MRPFPPVAGVEHRFVDAGGLRMHVAEAGPPDGEPVVLLHGWPQHWYCWRRVIPLIADRFRVLAPDLRGFGWTDAPRSSYAKAELAGDVVALLDALELDGVRLVGHDWGGWTAFLVAARAPERLRSVLGVGIVPPWSRGRPDLRSTLASLAYQPLVAAPFVGPAVQRFTPLVDAYFRLAGGRRIWSDEERRAFTDAFREPDRAEAASRMYRTFLTREVLASRSHVELRVPAKLLVGRKDPVVNESLVRGVRGMPVEWADAGHSLPEEVPDVVARAIP